MTQGNYANVNGLKMHYEVHGAGKPLVLLHGGLGNTELLGPVLPALAEKHRVIAVDLQGHGRTSGLDRPWSFEQMGDDMAALIQQLEVGKVDLLGYSLGGDVALQTAIRHPEVVDRLALVSIPFKSEGWYPEVRAGFRALNADLARMMMPSPPAQSYARIAPQPERWPDLVTAMGQLTRQDYDWSEGVKTLQMPTLLVYGDYDSVRPSHMVEFFQLLGGGQRDGGLDQSGMTSARLAILPGVTHYEIFSSPALLSTVLPFLG